MGNTGSGTSSDPYKASQPDLSKVSKFLKSTSTSPTESTSSESSSSTPSSSVSQGGNTGTGTSADPYKAQQPDKSKNSVLLQSQTIEKKQLTPSEVYYQTHRSRYGGGGGLSNYQATRPEQRVSGNTYQANRARNNSQRNKQITKYVSELKSETLAGQSTHSANETKIEKLQADKKTHDESFTYLKKGEFYGRGYQQRLHWHQRDQKGFTDQIRDIQNENKTIKTNESDRGDLIGFYEGEKFENEKSDAIARGSGDFSTSDDSRKPRIGIPPAPALGALAGANIAGKNLDNIKSFLGISTQQNSQSDYFSKSNVSKQNNDILLPSGDYIKIGNADKQQTSTQRYGAGVASVFQNLWQIGEESVKGVAKDIEMGSVGNYQPTELRKDVILSPIEAITREIEPSGGKIASGDLSGFSDYAVKTGEHLGAFAKDVWNDPHYYAGNLGSNVLVIAGTLGVGQAVGMARVGLATRYRQSVVQPKAQAILETIHPPKTVPTTKYIETGKIQVGKGGFEIKEFKPIKSTKPETETFSIMSSKQGDNIKIASPEPTGATKTQKISPIETFEQVADTQGYATYRGTFKDSGKYSSVEIVMTPKPVLRYQGKAPKATIETAPPSGLVGKLTPEAGARLSSNINKVPSFSKQFYQQEIKRGNLELIKKSSLSQDYYLASLGQKGGSVTVKGKGNTLVDVPLAKGEIGKIQKVSQYESEALGARSVEVSTVDVFSVSDVSKGLTYNPQFGNLLQSGKVKMKPLVSEIGSLDSQIFNANYLSGKTSLATAYDVKTKQPTKFENLTPYKKEFFFEGGLEYTAPQSKMKSFGESTSKGKTPKSDDPLQLLSKTKQDEVLAEFKGSGDFTKQTTKQSTPASILPPANSNQAFEYSVGLDQSPLEKQGLFNRPEQKNKQDDILGLGVASGLYAGLSEKVDSGLKLGVTPKFDSIQSFGNVLKQPTPQKTKEIVSPIYSFDFAQTPKQKQKKGLTPALVTEFVTETPLIVPIPPVDPPFFPPIKGGIPFAGLENDATWEWLKKPKKGKGKKRFHNVDPTVVLGHFKSGSLGYKSTEYKQLKGKKGKGKSRKGNQSSDTDFGNIFEF